MSPASMAAVKTAPAGRWSGRVVVPLTRHPGGIQAWKTVIPPEPGEPELRAHEGYEWLHVLAGRVRLVLADHDITLGPGEAAEFGTRLPHWFGPAEDQVVEVLSLLGRQGERIRVRAAPRREAASTGGGRKPVDSPGLH